MCQSVSSADRNLYNLIYNTEALIADINKDIEDGKQALDLPEFSSYASDPQLV